MSSGGRQACPARPGALGRVALSRPDVWPVRLCARRVGVDHEPNPTVARLRSGQAFLVLSVVPSGGLTDVLLLTPEGRTGWTWWDGHDLELGVVTLGEGP